MGYVLVYLAAIVAANLAIAAFGQAATVVVAFLFIGLDLTLRDRLHDAWSGRDLLPKMTALIAAGGVLSYLLNASAGPIALASCVAFGAAAGCDAVVYHTLRRRGFLARSNGSNIVGSAVDSIVFPTLAFGVFLPWVILGQFAAKVCGGFLWSLLLRYKRLAAVACILAIPSVASAQPVIVSAHYDVAREAPIASVVYSRLVGPVFVNGFLEAWRNGPTGFPANEWSVFSKHWVSRRITERVSLSVELEVLYNRAGVAFSFPAPIDFRPGERRLHVAPKVGLSFRAF
jgi:hypothetical protein